MVSGGRFGELCGRQSPRLCGWLCEVSFRATSPAAAAVLRGRRQGVERWGLLGRRHSPRLCGWLCEVSLRATSSAAELRMGVKRQLRQWCRGVNCSRRGEMQRGETAVGALL